MRGYGPGKRCDLNLCIIVKRHDNHVKSEGLDSNIIAGKLERGTLGMCNAEAVSGGAEGFEP